MRFGLMFFSSLHQQQRMGLYNLVLDAASFADKNGFTSVWLPERHFHEFGGLFPNPAVLAAAVAQITSRIQLRAGSIISPLHDPLALAEDWSMVDNLSNGRVAISFGSGWNEEDFVFSPESYSGRRDKMFEQIDLVLTLWNGGSIRRCTPTGREIDIRTFPRPLQPKPEIWITSGGSDETFIKAGAIGANVLTSLEKQDTSTLFTRIQKYRYALEHNGFDPGLRKVTLMLHTFLLEDQERAKEMASRDLCRYLRSAISLEWNAACGTTQNGLTSTECLVDKDLEYLTKRAFERYFHGSSLMGTMATCLPFVRELQDGGVNEIACLIDFIDSPELVLESLGHVDRLRSVLLDQEGRL